MVPRPYLSDFLIVPVLGTLYFPKLEFLVPFLGIVCYVHTMIVVGTDLVEACFAAHKGHKGIDAARTQYGVWLKIMENSAPKTPRDIKKMHPKASILKGGRVVFNIKANDFRLVALVHYVAGVMQIRFFGSHEEYDEIDAEKV